MTTELGDLPPPSAGEGQPAQRAGRGGVRRWPRRPRPVVPSRGASPAPPRHGPSPCLLRRLSLPRRGGRGVGLALALLLAAPPAFATQPDERLSDPALERRAREISAGLRCLVCQNQSIDDSDAPLAKDLRVLVRDRLKAGDGDRQVLDYVVSRYGEFVLLRPVLAPHTALLWLTPLLVLGAGAVGLVFALRRRGQAPAAPALSAAEQASLDALLERDRAR